MASRTLQLAIKRGDLVLDQTINSNAKLKHTTWLDMQQYYDDDHSLRDTAEKFNINQQSIIKASKRGDFKLRSVSDGLVQRFAKHGPNRMSAEKRLEHSKRMSEHNPGGRSKWYEVSGKKVQGTWERDFAMTLDSQQIEWQRCKSIKYVDGDAIKRYTPDFYLPLRNVYIEIKGHWWGNDRHKMNLVLDQHSDKTIIIIESYDDLINFK